MGQRPSEMTENSLGKTKYKPVASRTNILSATKAGGKLTMLMIKKRTGDGDHGSMIHNDLYPNLVKYSGRKASQVFPGNMHQCREQWLKSEV
jgi:hypothetical protein